MKKKSLIFISLVVLMLSFLLSGCSSNKTAEAPKTTAPAVEQKPAAPAKDTKPAVEETKTFSNAAYNLAFKYPASMRVDLMDNNTIKLTSKTNASYFIRCEQKFVEDSKKLGLNNEGTAKSFIKISVDNLKKVDAISNYSESSSTDSDGAGTAEAVFNAQTSSGYGKMRMQVVVMNNYIIATTLWAGEQNYDKSVKELESITDTLEIL
ncbi:MAG: hypothetical protein ABRQ26_12300 [Syntrophomonadaceae bacterium]